MKINIIENVRIPTEKAHGYQISKMCEEYANLGYEVLLVVPRRNNNIVDSVFRFYNLKNNFKIKYVSISELFLNLHVKYKFEMFKKIISDLIITRDPFIVFLFKLKRKKVFLEAHNWPERKGSIYKFLIRNVDIIICNSKGTAQKHIDEGLKNVVVAPNGVDLKKFNIEESKEELRKEFSLPLDKKIIMYVGHLYKWKGIDSVVDLAEKMRDKGDVIFVIVGGLKNDVEKYKSITKNKKLNNLLFLGHQKKEEIPKYLKTADILLLPNVPVSEESIKYTSPIKMFEYMASRVLIIASDLPSIKEVLNDNNSILFKAGDVDDLFVKVEKSLDMEESDKNKIVKKAYSNVLEYTWGSTSNSVVTN